jgi:hypothetical protein
VSNAMQYFFYFSSFETQTLLSFSRAVEHFAIKNLQAGIISPYPYNPSTGGG